MARFQNRGRVNYKNDYSFSWIIADRTGIQGGEVYFGLNGESGIGGAAHLANSMRVEDAEAIGYSLLAAAKAAREANE
jgi:hypothetical protein